MSEQTPIQSDRVRQAFLAGQPINVIAQEFGMTTSAMIRWMRENIDPTPNRSAPSYQMPPPSDVVQSVETIRTPFPVTHTHVLPSSSDAQRWADFSMILNPSSVIHLQFSPVPLGIGVRYRPDTDTIEYAAAGNATVQGENAVVTGCNPLPRNSRLPAGSGNCEVIIRTNKAIPFQTSSFPVTLMDIGNAGSGINEIGIVVGQSFSLRVGSPDLINMRSGMVVYYDTEASRVHHIRRGFNMARSPHGTNYSNAVIRSVERSSSNSPEGTLHLTATQQILLLGSQPANLTIAALNNAMASVDVAQRLREMNGSFTPTGQPESQHAGRFDGGTMPGPQQGVPAAHQPGRGYGYSAPMSPEQQAAATNLGDGFARMELQPRFMQPGAFWNLPHTGSELWSAGESILYDSELGQTYRAEPSIANCIIRSSLHGLLLLEATRPVAFDVPFVNVTCGTIPADAIVPANDGSNDSIALGTSINLNISQLRPQHVTLDADRDADNLYYDMSLGRLYLTRSAANRPASNVRMLGQQVGADNASAIVWQNVSVITTQDILIVTPPPPVPTQYGTMPMRPQPGVQQAVPISPYGTLNIPPSTPGLPPHDGPLQLADAEAVARLTMVANYVPATEEGRQREEELQRIRQRNTTAEEMFRQINSTANARIVPGDPDGPGLIPRATAEDVARFMNARSVTGQAAVGMNRERLQRVDVKQIVRAGTIFTVAHARIKLHDVNGSNRWMINPSPHIDGVSMYLQVGNWDDPSRERAGSTSGYDYVAGPHPTEEHNVILLNSYCPPQQIFSSFLDQLRELQFKATKDVTVWAWTAATAVYPTVTEESQSTDRVSRNLEL